MESQEHIFMINSSVERTRGNRAINTAEDENYGEILKSGDNTLLRYKIFDGDGEILPLEGLPCESVIKKEDKVVYRTPAEIDAENIVSFKIDEVLPSDRNNPYTIEFIITNDQDTLIFPSDDRINLYIYPSSLSADGDIINQTPEARLNEIVIVAVNDATQDIYSEVDNIRATLSALDPNDTSGELQQIKDDIAQIETDLANITPGNYDQEIQQINDELTTINNALSTYETPSGAQEKADAAETNAKAYADSILTGSGGGVSSWNDLMDKPSTFTPSEHTHTMTEVNGLQAVLDGLETTIGLEEYMTTQGQEWII